MSFWRLFATTKDGEIASLQKMLAYEERRNKRQQEIIENSHANNAVLRKEVTNLTNAGRRHMVPVGRVIKVLSSMLEGDPNTEPTEAEFDDAHRLLKNLRAGKFGDDA